MGPLRFDPVPKSFRRSARVSMACKTMADALLCQPFVLLRGDSPGLWLPLPSRPSTGLRKHPWICRWAGALQSFAMLLRSYEAAAECSGERHLPCAGPCGCEAQSRVVNMARNRKKGSVLFGAELCCSEGCQPDHGHRQLDGAGGPRESLVFSAGFLTKKCVGC